MGFTDVEQIVNLIPEQISEDDKENLIPDIANLEISSEEISSENTVKLFKISQQLLKFKAEQVESLISELDELAAKLGVEEAKNNHSSAETFRSRTNENGILSLPDDADDLQRQLVKMEIQASQLTSELQEKERELINEKEEIDKLGNQISILEEENRKLKNELQATQQELSSSATGSKLTAEEHEYPSLEKYHELTELLRQKNKHITQLLNDIEDIEKENIQLKDQLSTVEDELSDGANKMSKLSMERLSLSACVDELKSKCYKLEQENAGLRNQISELVIDKEEKDKHMETMRANYEYKIQQLKETLQKKENELIFSRVQFPSTGCHSLTEDHGYLSQLSQLNKEILEREEKIVELQRHLEQATLDLNESTRLLEQQQEEQKSRSNKNTESKTVKQLKKALEQCEMRIVVLDAKVHQAEQESLRKAEEVTELITQLREYESGTYGLEEAMNRLKDIEKQKKVRDAQIQQLISNTNQLQDDVNLLEQENQILKERLGISPDEQIVIDDITRKTRDRHGKLNELSQELEKCQNDLISYKVENRNLKKQISALQKEIHTSTMEARISLGSDEEDFPNPDHIIRENYQNDAELYSQNQLQDVINENESLRKGMHEILDSIRNKDGCSFIQIECESLERLLEALDSRHVTGWYQPAMRLQAYIHHLNGVNQILREQLHIYRNREEQLIYELHEANQKYHLKTNQYQPMTKPSTPDRRISLGLLKKSKSYSDDISKVDIDIKIVKKELEAEKDRCRTRESEIQNLKEKFVEASEQMKKLNEKYDAEKAILISSQTSLEKELADAVHQNRIQMQKLNEYEKSFELLKLSPDEKSRAIVEYTLSYSTLQMEQLQLTRKYQALSDTEIEVRQARNSLNQQLVSIKAAKDREIAELRKINENLSAELKNQITNARECVSRKDHENYINQFQELTVKHREILNKQILLHTRKDQLILQMQNEISVLQTQKTELEVNLKSSILEDSAIIMSTSQTENKTSSDQLNLINAQSLEYANHMLQLIKQQLLETENRCEYLEAQLSQAIEANSAMQKNEATLRETLLELPNTTEFQELKRKFKISENKNALLQSEKAELEEFVNIAQEQIRTLEQYHKYQDFEFDALQRRVLELQSHSDEKVVIDRLTKEILSLKRIDHDTITEAQVLKNTLARAESELLQTKMKLNEKENDCNRQKRDSDTKIRHMYSILYELQKRYLGSYSLVREELCFEKIIGIKEECYELTSLLLCKKPTSILSIDQYEDELNAFLRNQMIPQDFQKFKFKIQLQHFNMRLVNESLQKEIELYAERLEKKDKLIDRLEQEIIHAYEQCQEFLNYWDPTLLKESHRARPISDTKATQTPENFIPTAERNAEETNRLKISQANETINELREKLSHTQIELVSTRNELEQLFAVMKHKEFNDLSAASEQEILNLETIKEPNNNTDENSDENSNEENSVKKLVLKSTVDSLRDIITQKEKIIARLRILMKKNSEEHSQSIVKLLSELKTVQDSVDAKDQICNRLKSRLENLEEKSPPDKKNIIDLYITRIHDLEDELNQATEKIDQLSKQLTNSRQQTELWTRTAEERLKTQQSMKREFETKHQSVGHESPTMSYSSLLQIVKEKTEKIERQDQTIEALQKRLESGEKLPGYRDRLKNELVRCKKKLETMEQRERDDKAEIQRLRNHMNNRPISARKKESLAANTEEQLHKKIKNLEKQLEEFIEKEKKWTLTRRAQIDSELGKWECKKRNQHIQEKLRQRLKDLSRSNESLKISNDRLKETVMRLEKERMTLDSKLKAIRVPTPSMSLVEELQKTNARLEEELKILYKRSELSSGSQSLTDVIELQERKIKSMELAQKGDLALAKEIEKLNERKSQLQKYNVHLEEENLQLKMQIKRLKSGTDEDSTQSDTASKINKIYTKDLNENASHQAKGNQRRTNDLEKAVSVLRRVVEKLQAENKRLHNNQIQQIQDKNQTEKLQTELNNLQQNYLDAIEKNSIFEKNLETANRKIETLEKLIDRLHNGEEITTLKTQLSQKNHLLGKVKVLLEKAALREKELLAKVNDLRENSGI